MITSHNRLGLLSLSPMVNSNLSKRDTHRAYQASFSAYTSFPLKHKNYMFTQRFGVAYIATVAVHHYSKLEVMTVQVCTLRSHIDLICGSH